MTKSKKPRAKRKNENELIADAKALLATREARLAQKTLKDDPKLEAIFQISKNSAKLASDAAKGLDSSHPQNFANRLQGHTLWVDVINAEEILATAALQPLKDRAKLVKDVVSEAVVAASNGDWDEVQTLTGKAQSVSEKSLPGKVSALETKFINAQKARKDFTDQKRQSASE